MEGIEFPKGFSGPWCVTCCIPRPDLAPSVSRNTPTVGHPECPNCGDTAIEWSD